MEPDGVAWPLLAVVPANSNCAGHHRGLHDAAIFRAPLPGNIPRGLADPKLRTAPSLSDPRYAEENLSKNLSVADAGAGSQMKVSYEDTDPEAAAIVCNAIVNSYLRQHDAFNRVRFDNLERWLEPEIQRWEQEVEQRKRVVHELNQLLMGNTPDTSPTVADSNSNVAFTTQLRSQLNDVTLRIAVIDAQLSQIEPTVEAKTEEHPSLTQNMLDL